MSEHKHDDAVSRRSFLQRTGAGLAATPLGAAPLPAQAPEQSGFQPGAKPEKLSDNLFLLEDTCNVYLIRKGDRGLLIDFGSGKILDYLGDLGISRIDWILHTHFHRDQAQGDPLAVAQRIPIAVPQHEREFFESAENFWRNRRIFEMYEVRNDFFSLTKNVPVTALLRDYGTFRWEGLEIFIQPTPGHTLGSITLVTRVDGKNVAFSGDLLHSRGKVQTLYDLQYYYSEHEGVDLSIYSLTELAKLKPELLCPSHGRSAYRSAARNGRSFRKADGLASLLVRASAHVTAGAHRGQPASDREYRYHFVVLRDHQRQRQSALSRLRLRKLDILSNLHAVRRHLRPHAICRTQHRENTRASRDEIH